MLVYMALLMPILLLFCGLVVDVGQMEVVRLQMQGASDAASLGAAQEVERGIGNYVAFGQSEAATNGFTDGSSGTTVTVTRQPTYGAYAGFYDAVQTTITQQVPLTFLRLLGKRASTVSTQSTALVAPCAYISGAAGLANPVMQVSSSTLSSSCPWYINSSVGMDGSSSFSALAENVTGSAGASNWTVAAGSSPRYAAETHGDPLSWIAQPTAGTCSATTSLTAGTTLAPGTYCGLTVKCVSTCIVYTQPGMYTFAGGLTAVNAVFYGSNATFYFTKYGSNYGTVSLRASGSGNYCLFYMSAPADSSAGAIPGVMLMNDRNWVHTSAQDFTFTSTNNANYAGILGEGIVYVTGTGISLNNAILFADTQYLAIDVDNLAVSGNSTVSLKSDFSAVSGGSPFLPQGGLVQ